jgi:hypothetical protein
LQTAFVQALQEAKVSHANAARWIGTSKATIARWVHLRSRIDVEAVLASTQLGERFRRALCTHSHDESVHVDAPHVARPKARVTSKRSAKLRSLKGNR